MAKLYCSKVEQNPYRETMVTEIIDKVFCIHGDQIADRILEGIMFNIHFDDTGVTKVDIEKQEIKKYVESNFNSDRFYKIAKDIGNDILSTGDEVDVPSYIKQKYFINGINCAYILK